MTYQERANVARVAQDEDDADLANDYERAAGVLIATPLKVLG